MLSELFREQYDFEMEQRNALASALNIPIVATTVVASAASAVLLDFPYRWSFQAYAFLAFATGALLAVFFAVYSIFRSFWNYEYQKLPTPTALKRFHDDLVAWHTTQGSSTEEAQHKAGADFGEYLDARLAEAVGWNGQNNLVRGNYLHRATASVAFAVATFIPAAVIYAHSKATAEEKTYQVRLVSPGPQQKVTNMAEPSPPASAPAPSAPAAAPASAPTSTPTVSVAKPVGPPNSLFKSNTELVKPSAGTSAPPDTSAPKK